LWSEVGPQGKSERSYLKNKYKKNRERKVAPVVEHLSSKYKALSSYPNIANNK
jgi:hypothetical protein